MKPFSRLVKQHHFPSGEVLLQEVFMVVIALHIGDAFNLLQGIILFMPFPHHREDLRMHGSIRH